MTKRGCATCEHAKFSLTATGRIARGVAGKCTYSVALPVLPGCAKLTEFRLAIWPDSYPDCQTWKKTQ